MSWLRHLANDEAGFVISSELVMVATVVVIGMVTGLVTVRNQVVEELGDLATSQAVANQSYSYSGATAHSASVAGSLFNDRADFCGFRINDITGQRENTVLPGGAPGIPE